MAPIVQLLLLLGEEENGDQLYFRFLFLAMRPPSDVTLNACRST
jgi:hypothetical protein